jgi:3-isopropylmalate/(R)-2-methylmalate dehydratase small subunit
MKMEKFTTLTSKMVSLPINDIDTDQIIPARFLKVLEKDGLGDNLFADWRYNEDGTPKADFTLNLPENRNAKILLAGDNFGCGSSREHAPWALTGYGFRAVLSTSFADIFFNNAQKNGLLLVVLEPEVHQYLLDIYQLDSSVEITIDLENQVVQLPNADKVSFPVDSFARHCLIEGVDQLGYILSHAEDIDRYEQLSQTCAGV